MTLSHCVNARTPPRLPYRSGNSAPRNPECNLSAVTAQQCCSQKSRVMSCRSLLLAQYRVQCRTESGPKMNKSCCLTAQTLQHPALYVTTPLHKRYKSCCLTYNTLHEVLSYDFKIITFSYYFSFQNNNSHTTSAYFPLRFFEFGSHVTKPTLAQDRWLVEWIRSRFPLACDEIQVDHTADTLDFPNFFPQRLRDRDCEHRSSPIQLRSQTAQPSTPRTFRNSSSDRFEI